MHAMVRILCMHAGNGYVAVGARDGKIRLYPGAKMDRAASTSIPGLGAPITAIDVTFDGESLCDGVIRCVLCGRARHEVYTTG